MLTGLIEKGRNKCELYFPLGKTKQTAEKSFMYVKTTKIRDKFTFDCKNTQLIDEEIVEFEELNEIIFGNYKITYIDVENLGECSIRQLELKKLDESIESRTIYHYWFADWPDHKMANPEQVLKIALHVLTLSDNNKKTDNNINMNISNGGIQQNSTKFNNDLNNQKDLLVPIQQMAPPSGIVQRKKSIDNVRMPIIVHCSAGIGRTGCFLAILNGIQQLKMNFNVDVLAILCSLRLNRGGMVQTAEQYELIHRVLSLYTEMM